ncbi:MAG: DMT family transporter [Alphaproteobacteria bacterium]|jgi:drug/metabolite transporter (DMT)-like permease|nr:DMT family transporter [Alphaproteobacteria bacterium]MDP6564089.1 DMT family transporter [Alphaproteobacteria bacterium]MDP6811935.1 DMT family transporter [Alphaproteobacteria bacterium]
MAVASQGRNQFAGILLMLAAILMFSVMDLLAKYLAQSLPVVQVAWARYFGHFIIMAVLFWPRRGPSLLHTRRPGLQWLRSLLLLMCTVVFFLAISYMPLADAVAITFVSPLMVTALSVPLLGEAVGGRRWTAVAVGFIGAMVIVRPGLGVMHWASWLVLVMALGFALYQITTRMLSRTDDPITTLFYSALVGTGCLSLVVPFQWRMPPEPVHWLMMVGLGLLGGLGHYALIKAHESAPVAVLAPLTYTALLWNVLFGFVVFGDLPDRWTLIGAAVLIATGIYILYREGLRAGGSGAKKKMRNNS